MFTGREDDKEFIRLQGGFFCSICKTGVKIFFCPQVCRFYDVGKYLHCGFKNDSLSLKHRVMEFIQCCRGELRVADNIKAQLGQNHNNCFQFFCSILTISVLRTHGYMNSPVKLDSCLHIRFSMSALKGKAAE